MHSLCIADQLGVLKSIEHIAKALHAESQPPPPPHVSYPKPRQSSKSQQSAETCLNSLTPENTSLEIATLNGDSKEVQGTCNCVNSGEESHSQIVAPLQSQSLQSTNINVESETTDSYVEKDGLRNRKKGTLEPKPHVVEPKFAPSDTELKEMQVAIIATVADTGLRMFGIGAGTFML